MEEHDQQSDYLIWQAFKKGDKSALDHIFRRYYPMLYNYGIKLSGSPSLTEDCLQDFFLYLYEHRSNLKNLETISPYLFKAFRNRLFKSIKRRRSFTPLQDLKKEFSPIQFSIEEIIINQETAKFQKELLYQQLNALPRRQKELVYLKSVSYTHLTLPTTPYV